MRILLKLSGEALMDKKEYGIHNEYVHKLCTKIKTLVDNGMQVAIVVGGGNIFRGIGQSADGMRRNNADSIGMLATVINTVALHDAFTSIGVPSQIYTAKTISSVGKTFTYDAALGYLNKGGVVILGGGTGNPFFTTDTAGVLRALELECELMIKATKVDYLYDKDPKKHADAQPIEQASYDEILEKKLGVMDLAAIALARDNHLKIMIMDIDTVEQLTGLQEGKDLGTIIG